MFTVHYQIVGKFENYMEHSTLAEARAFAASLKDTVYVDITDGDKSYPLVAPTLH